MGTTYSHLTSEDSARIGFVLCIEGCPYLLHTGTGATAASVGWDGTGWTSALAGLLVDGDFAQSIEPLKFTASESELKLKLIDDTETFAELTNKTGAGNQTELTADATANAYTLTVRDTTNFAASGTVYIGTERITYTGKTGTSFTGCTRGTLHPFSVDGGTANRFGRDHTLADLGDGVAVGVKVTDEPRQWVGRHVGLWLHRIAGDTWDTQAQAQCIFAGSIVDIGEGPDGVQLISCADFSRKLHKTTLFHGQYSGKLREGSYIPAGASTYFRAIEGVTTGGVSTINTADDLATVTGAPANANELQQGYYTSQGDNDLSSYLHAWLSNERAIDANLTAYWTFSIVGNASQGHRTQWVVRFNDSVVYSFIGVKFRIPLVVAELFGFTNYDVVDGLAEISMTGSGTNAVLVRLSENAPLRVQAFTGAPGIIELVDTRGTVFDNRDYMPANMHHVPDTGEELAVIQIGERTFRVAVQIDPDTWQFGGRDAQFERFFGSAEEPEAHGLTLDEDGEIEVKQIAILYGKFDAIVSRLFASTGATVSPGVGYNHADYDAFPAHMGCAIPWEILGDNFEFSLIALSSEQSPNEVLMVIDRPTKLISFLAVEMLMRGASLIWKQGGFQLTKWSQPASVAGVHILTEANKAGEPSDPQRTYWQTTSEWLTNVWKISYNRDLVTGTYRSTVSLKAAASIAEFGEQQPFEFKAANSFGQYAGTTSSVEAQVAELAATLMPMFARPLRRMRRTIALPLFLQMAPGDLALVSDNGVRDPATGTPGITSLPAVVLSTSYNWGVASSEQSLFGEADLLFADFDRNPVYSPSAEVDETAANGGYDSGYDTLTFKAHEFSKTSETVDIGSFAANDDIYIYEVDDPVGAQSWTATIVSVDSGANTAVIDSPLAGYDTSGATIYRIEARRFAVTAAQQRGKAFMASSTDDRIQDLADAYEYGSVYEGGAFQASPSTELPDLPSVTGGGTAFGYADGHPVTPGNHRGMVRTVNNHIDYRSQIQLPVMVGNSTGAAIAGPSGASWELTWCMPYFFGPNGGPAESRTFSVAPMIASSGGGNSVECRVTISLYPPVGDSLLDVEFVGPRDQGTFTSNTTAYLISAADALNQIGRKQTGVGFLSLELRGEGGHGSRANLRGLAEFSQSARSLPTVHAIQHRQYARNGRPVRGGIVKKIAEALNFAAANRRKAVFMQCRDLPAMGNGAAGTTNLWRWHFHAGHGVSKLGCLVIMAPTIDAASQDAYVDLQVTESGGATTTSAALHYSAFSPSSDPAPSGWLIANINPVTLADNTSYECLLRAVDYARVCAVLAYEIGETPVDSADSAGVNAAIGAGSSILDAEHQDCATAVTALWQKNGGHLFSWSSDGTTNSPTRAASATWRNIFDSSSTTISSATPGFRTQLEFKNRVSSTTCPVAVAVYGVRTAGAGSAADNRVRVTDGGSNTIEVTGFDNTPAWHTATGTLTASADLKLDVQARTNATDTIRIDAVCVYLLQ